MTVHILVGGDAVARLRELPDGSVWRKKTLDLVRGADGVWSYRDSRTYRVHWSSVRGFEFE